MRIATSDEVKSIFLLDEVWPLIAKGVPRSRVDDLIGLGIHLTDNGNQIVSIDKKGYMHVAANKLGRSRILYTIKRAVEWGIDNTKYDILLARIKISDSNLIKICEAVGFKVVVKDADRIIYAYERKKGDVCHLLKMQSGL